MFIPVPGFLTIPDLGSQIRDPTAATKEEGEIFLILNSYPLRKKI
jgi:hypothetical protein